jgi:putative tryptophan/tyrosine transport system substrate-binding protein
VKRRTFIAGLGSAAAWPLAATAQQNERVRRIGMLLSGGQDDTRNHRSIATFAMVLAKSSWTEGRNISIKLLWGHGDAGRIQNNVSEIVRAAPDLIVATGSEATVALKQQTDTLPIVFVLIGDPVAQGLVASFARPSGNITGFTSEEASIAGKWLTILKEIAPATTNVMVLCYQENPSWQGHWATIRAAAPTLEVGVSLAAVPNASEIAHNIERFAQDPSAGMVVVPSGMMSINRDMIAELAARRRLPAVYPHSYFVASGGLVSYGADENDLYRRAAEYANRILRGAKPADLPVQAPTKFEFAVNLKAANALGLTVPSTLLVNADKVLE